MADEIDVLLARVEDERLRQELATHVGRLRQRRRFGLVFEDHLPESVVLPQHQIRRGVKVVPREDQTAAPMVVMKVKGKKATLTNGAETTERPVDELVAVAEFGEPIYPGLTPLGSIERGGDKPAHVVIKGENHHALEALQFTHTGKVDCIYIDPPYNTGARDWKYNNDYVDGDDAYRHSKWLAFMKRRLRIAKSLLRPDDSVLLVTIDERELHRLCLLLEQEFPEADLQLATAVINRAGSPKPGRLNRVEEYVVFVFIGDAGAFASSSNLLHEASDGDLEKMPTVWFSAMRVGAGKALRSYYDETVLFYPVYLESGTGRFHSVGEPLPMSQSYKDAETPEGLVAIWPVSKGVEQTWRFTREKMIEYIDQGTARFGRLDADTGLRPITYLRPGTLDNIENGIFKIVGRSDEGVVELALGPTGLKGKPPATVWNLGRHYARDYGSKLNSALIPGRNFPYPKALYAVEDALRIATGHKPNAVVLDFFAGSGTTAHAVFRLNRQDGGSRTSIVVTNNEVSPLEAAALTEEGHRPGDPKWERAGIFEHITRPRIEACVTGLTPEGDSVVGNYKFVDEFPMSEGFAENVEFLGLEYLDPEAVSLDYAFDAISTLLWLRAGSSGSVITEPLNSSRSTRPYASTESYGVLFNPDSWRAFVDHLPSTASHVFIVTDSVADFTSVAGELPVGVEAVRLYENYLSTFAINTGATL